MNAQQIAIAAVSNLDIVDLRLINDGNYNEPCFMKYAREFLNAAGFEKAPIDFKLATAIREAAANATQKIYDSI